MSTKPTITKWQTEMVKLNDTVYAYIQTRGTFGLSNAGLIIGEKNVAIIDSLNSSPSAQTFLNEIQSVTDRVIKYLIITHSHPDHIFGNNLLPDATKICQQKCYEEIKNMSEGEMRKIHEIFAKNDSAKFIPINADLTFQDNLTLFLENKRVELLYFGYAHSFGDIVVYLPEDKIVFCGDLLFYQVTPSGFSGLNSGWIKALTRISELEAETFVPGHGPPCDRQGLLKCLEYLKLIYSEAENSFGKGLSYYDAAKNIKLGEFKSWTEPERLLGNVACIYRELKGIDPKTPIDIPGTIKETIEFAKSGWLG